MTILRFPVNPEDVEIENAPITEENIALVNAIGATINQWLREHPKATRQDIEWALGITGDVIARRASE